MSLPFTRDQFLDVFHAYNEAIGFAPLLLLALAIAVVALAYGRKSRRHQVIASLLALLWLWSGVVYHWGFFAVVNPVARAFGALFVAQAVVLFWFGVVRSRWEFDPRHAPAARVGWLLVVYALFIYPLLGWMFGHGYPSGPSFGAPCPVTIFFLGTTLWIAGGVPVAAVIVPLLWSIVGTSAAIGLGMYEDFGLAASAVIVLASMLRRRLTGSRPTRPNEGKQVVPSMGT
jgi:hypothetical protein